MTKSSLLSDREIAEIFERHILRVYRVCFAYMKNKADAEDAVQDTFYKLIKTQPHFESEEHEKAWLIRAATNTCKNALRNWWRKRESLDDHHSLSGSEEVEIDNVFSTIMGLPEKYKTVVYLYYYEGYDSVEISRIVGRPQSTIRYQLHIARKLLKEKLGSDFIEE